MPDTYAKAKRVIKRLLELSEAEFNKAIGYIQAYAANPDIEILLNALSHITNAEQLLTSFYWYGSGSPYADKILSLWERIRQAMPQIRSTFMDYLQGVKEGEL